MSKWTVPQLLDKAEECLDAFQPDLALNFCKKALEMESNNVLVQQTIASVYIELGLVEQAVSHLQKALELEPESGYSKFLTLGQISNGQQALQFYKRGFEIFQNEKDKYKLSQIEFDHRLASILCSQAELFMTDLCMEENAEAECENLLLKSKEICGQEPEVYKLLSDLRMAQCRDEEAKEEILNCLNLFISKEPGSPEFPSFDLRASLARNCIELQLYQDAYNLLTLLVREDDEHLINYYLFSLTCFNLGLKAECLEYSSCIIEKLEKFPDPELNEAVIELQEKAQLLSEEIDVIEDQSESD
jgi:tetratricopeptide (TPR) repeat protein